MKRLLLLSIAALFVFVSVQAQDTDLDLRGTMDPQSGAIDVDRLRDRVLSQALPFSDPLSGMPFPGEQAGRLDADLELAPWGVQLIPVPDVLRPAHKALHDGAGLLVLDILPGMAAEQAGIQPGMVLIEQEGTPLQRVADLRRPLPNQRLIVLTVDGLRTAKVNQHAMPELPLHDLIPAGESVSVSNVNGLVCIDATLSTAKGMKRLQLRGTPAEIDRQIEELPQELALQLRQRVSY